MPRKTKKENKANKYNIIIRAHEHIVQKRMDAKLIVIKDWADRGKSLTIWMVLMELIKRGANVTWFTYNYN